MRGPEVSWPLPASGRPPGSGHRRWEGRAHAGELRCRSPPPCAAAAAKIGAQPGVRPTPFIRSCLTPSRRVLRAPITRPRLSAPHCLGALLGAIPNLQGYGDRAKGTSLTSVWFQSQGFPPIHFSLSGVVRARENRPRKNFLPRTGKKAAGCGISWPLFSSSAPSSSKGSWEP